ncbi:MAG: lamin tail domain-containing protein [Planctomycetota bacterium]
MLTALLLLAATACPQGQGNPRVVINEVQYEDYPSAALANQYEFLELYNRTNAAVDISGWYVEGTTYASGLTNLYATFTVPNGTTLAAGGFYVMGSALVPNVNQVIGTTAILHDNAGIFVLKDSGGTIEDTVYTEANKGIYTGAPAEGPGLWGNFRSGRTDQLFSSWSRQTDGYDTNNNGRDFINTSATPGTTNNRTGILPYADNFDGYSAGFSLPEWAGSFKEVRVIDPTVAANFNPNAIPASPQGGLAAIAWDETGGGNSNQLLDMVGTNFVIECYAYFDTTAPPVGELDAWSIGAQGTCDSFYNLPDPERTAGRTANGNIGVAWILLRTDVETALYLVDHNDGGTDFTVFGKIPIVAGTNDGWQRLRLQVRDNFVEGRLGGTYGARDGTVVAGRITGAPGGVYIGYREFLTNNGTCRPFTCDQLSIKTGNAAVNYFETALATTVGTPAATPRGFPLIGDPNYGIDYSGLVPNSLSLLVIGGGRQTPPLPLTLFGGPPNSQLVVAPAATVNLPASAQGTLSVPLALPAVNGFVGVPLYTQLLNVDPALTFPLPIGHTDGLEIVIGN